MEKIIINNDDIRLSVRIQNKLMEYYGASYKQELPNLYNQLIDLLNADDYYTQLVEKGANDVEYQSNAVYLLQVRLLSRFFDVDEGIIQKMNKLNVNEANTDEEITQIMNEFNKNPEKQLFFDTLSSIIERLYRESIIKVLEDYIRKKEPSLRDISGVNDINQCNFVIERYKEYVKSLSVEARPSRPLVNDNNQLVIQKGDLFHGTLYSEEVIISI